MDPALQYFGWCDACGVVHALGTGNALVHARRLMDELATTRRIDYRTPAHSADPRFSTAYLFGAARGQMFGVLECRDQGNQPHFLHAFSSQYNGVWLLDGWVPPVFCVEAYEAIMVPGDKEIKRLGREIDALPSGDPARNLLRRERKRLSQRLMKELHSLYTLVNFRGETRPLGAFFSAVRGAPTGAGDCCAPKLLQYAALHALRPVGLAEFYWGRDNASGHRQHGMFYPACLEKCAPILGFMLCGVGA
ncbi:MAG: hypothetical protein EOM20_17905 [Spartobacteria bacterium]|nr:hypothetical protein [Spartobacteria bacterium]